MPLAAGGKARTTLWAIPVITACASHLPERRMRISAQYERCRGREGHRPLSVPAPGSRMLATISQQKITK